MALLDELLAAQQTPTLGGSEDFERDQWLRFLGSASAPGGGQVGPKGSRENPYVAPDFPDANAPDGTHVMFGDNMFVRRGGSLELVTPRSVTIGGSGQGVTASAPAETASPSASDIASAERTRREFERLLREGGGPQPETLAGSSAPGPRQFQPLDIPASAANRATGGVIPPSLADALLDRLARAPQPETLAGTPGSTQSPGAGAPTARPAVGPFATTVTPGAAQPFETVDPAALGLSASLLAPAPAPGPAPGPDADAIMRGAVLAAADRPPSAPPGGGERSISDRLRDFFAVLQGQDPRRAETESMTVRALIARGMDPNLATVVSRNPQLLQSVLASLMGRRNPTIVPEGASVLMPDGRTIAPGAPGGRERRAFEQGVGRQQAERLGAINTAAQTARDMMANLDAMERALNEYNRQSLLGTGNLAPYEAALRRTAQHFGIAGADTVAAAELVTSIQNRMALLMRNPDGGMGMPGALSDADREFLRQSQPGIDKTPAGNRTMIETMRRLERRKIELAQLAAEHVRQHGSLTGFEETVRRFADANPLFADMGGRTPPSRPPGSGSVRTYNPQTGQLE